ncbi:hypothetical protein [Hymenobacter sp. BT730]|uniref:DUF6958 family protein n=1 Tax=Hymenobacter sp. BT730 TaxID=3063332 RepID=UPI0026DF6B08|nr:hypothetical protein [Hymenobacter sp. BT730]
MEKIQLAHPEGKKAISMNRLKYDALKSTLLTCLANKQAVPFQEILSDVENDLRKRDVKIEGKLEWNLFWVSLDLESKKELYKDRSVSPIKYSILKKL